MPTIMDMLDEGATTNFRQTTDQPTLIIVDSHIAYGAPHKQDTNEAHGEPLGDEEIKLTKRSLRLAGRRQVSGAGRRARAISEVDRQARGDAARGLDGKVRGVYRKKYPELADQLYKMQNRRAAGRLGQGHAGYSRRSPRVWQRATRPARC